MAINFKGFLAGATIGFALGFTAAIYIAPNGSNEMTGQNQIAKSTGPVAENASDSSGTVRGSKCKVSFSGIALEYAKAAAAVFDAAHDGYREKLGISLPDYVLIQIEVTGEETRLWTDGSGSIFLNLKSPEDLLPTSPYRNIYGFCHEPGHIAMYSRMATLAGMPDGVGEGWAHYAGSVVTDYVWEKLGENAWPIAHDYSVHGSSRLREQCKLENKDAIDIAACAFLTLGDKYGHENVGLAMREALLDKPSGAELMPRFKSAIVEIMGENAAQEIPDSLLVVEMKWQSSRLAKGGAPPDDFFNALKTGVDGWNGYNDGTNESMRSIAGSGHAVLFSSNGREKLDAVRLHGGRYGASTIDSVFRMTVLNTSFETIKSFEFPYMKFAERSEELYWVEFDTEGLKVPEAFFVCFDFAPTAYDGIYAGLDTSTAGHSFTALPSDHLQDFELGEWMIEVKLE